MDTQTLLNSLIVIMTTDLTPAQPVRACSRDYGFDFDEEEMGREMLAPLPVDLSSQAIPEADADEFEQGLRCFLS
jgi:hypothetical protein